MNRPRASVVVLRDDGREVLMVQHRRVDGTTYWQLPGGGLEAGESAEAAALRELREETGLRGHIVRHLFTMPYRLGLSSTFLVAVDSIDLALGVDPEEAASSHRKLIDVAWQPLDAVRDNPEIRAFLGVEAMLSTDSGN